MVKVNVNNLNVRTCLVCLSFGWGDSFRGFPSHPSSGGAGGGPLFFSDAKVLLLSDAFRLDAKDCKRLQKTLRKRF